MDKSIVTLDKGTTCSSWNYCGERLATGSIDGTLTIFDSVDPASSSFTCTSRSKAHAASIVKVVWVPPEYGDAVACISSDGTLSLWEEVVEETQPLQWKLCKRFEGSSYKVLDIQCGVSLTSLKLVIAYSDGHVKVYELLNPLELKNWQLQAEFQNVIDSVSKYGNASCMSASISWNPQRGGSQQSSFVLGFNSNILQLNSSKVWEFDQDHQRWLPVAELALPGDKGDQVYAVAWAPNIGRPYEVIAVATHKGIAIWHIGLNPDPDGRLSVETAALLSGHGGEVWQMEWDMSGMTLATTGSDGMALMLVLKELASFGDVKKLQSALTTQCSNVLITGKSTFQCAVAYIRSNLSSYLVKTKILKIALLQCPYWFWKG
ncbi:hypothetical protein RJ640_019025 [Escallonia rubra]|uniref:Uncharacterized protein n=1 Tax=Escallonia rubra TaxID=112253 RepID=A0AA88U2Q8_9ASTE|nr:hypothetical protein RJ640_019025 [Escallonia rubra]